MPKTHKEKLESMPVGKDKFDLVLEAIADLKNSIQRPITSQAPSLQPESAPKVEPPPLPEYPIPSGYRQLVDTVLNKNFGIELEAHSDAPVVTTVIVVPEKYSTRSTREKEDNPRDLRSKVMSLAGGVNELKEWLDIVYKSFPPELQAMIVAERSI